jgi:hypothetical protein
MIRGRPALLCFTAVAMCIANASRAGVWGTDPVLGLSSDYSTNPGLLYIDHTAETHAALLIDVPTTYVADAVKFSVLPSFRISNSSGYSSLASDYEHLTLIGEFDTERSTLTATGQLARDSSLYYNYYFNGSTGVRRDSALADLNWVRALTERWNLNVDVDSTRVQYGHSITYTTLTDYRYSSAAPSISWSANERSSFSLQAGIGDYNSLDGLTRSINSNVQLGFKRQLDELWNLSASAGVSRETDKIKTFFGPFDSTADGTVFAANVTRQGERLAVSGQASRSLVPSGYAFLSRQDTYQLSASYPTSERWTFNGHVRWLRAENPQLLAPTIDQSYLELGLSAVWLFTEHWTATFMASYVTDKVSPPPTHVDASGFSIQLARHFNHIAWH